MNIAELEAELKKQGIKNATGRLISGIWGMNEQSYSRKRKNGTDIKEKNIKQIEQRYNIILLSESAKAEGIRLDYYPDVKASCGTGNFVFSEAKEQIVIPPQAITDYSVHNKYTVIKATSDSMTPEIKPNDRLVIQHNIDRIIDNHIYIFSYAGELFCKYLSNNLGQIIVRSANTVYPVRYIEGEALKDFTLIGEVKAHIREYEV